MLAMLFVVFANQPLNFASYFTITLSFLINIHYLNVLGGVPVVVRTNDRAREKCGFMTIRKFQLWLLLVLKKA